LQKTPKCASIHKPVIVRQTHVCPRGHWWGVHATPAKECVRARPCHGAVPGGPSTPCSSRMRVPLAACGPAVVYVLRPLLTRHAMTAGAPRPDHALQLLGQTMRALRTQWRLTQRTLATRVGLTRPSVSAMERGRRHGTMWTLLQITAALQVPLAVRFEPLAQRPEL
jgi:DNA-binding XRE family transcriptional regulator